MKRIIMSLGVIIVVGAVYASATGAFFSDTETSTGNTFAAGDIDLQIGNTSYVTSTSTGALVASPANTWGINNLTNQLFFSFGDVKPGDVGADTIAVRAGSNDAYACMAGAITATPENTLVDPETDAGDAGPANGNNGELQNYLNFAFWNDDGDNVYETGETLIPGLSGAASTTFNGVWRTIADASSTALSAGTTVNVGKAWCFGGLTPTPVAQDGLTTVGPISRGTGFTCNGVGNQNDAQTDGIVVDMSFQAVQARNNGQFLCSSLPAFTGSSTVPVTGPTVGAVLGAYTAPTCNATVTGDNSIQTAIDTASAGQTVCVDPTYTGAGDNTPIQVNKDVTLAATVQGVDLDVPVVLASDGVTVTGFDGVIGQAATPAERAAFYVLGPTDNFEISFNRVTGGTGAAVLTESGGTNNGGLIANNVLSGATQGIYTNPHTGTITIEKNDIDNNVAGIGGLNGATVINNEFNNTSVAAEAIGIDSTFNANAATINYNNFLNGIKINDYGATPIISAENNFFNAGGVNQTTGAADVDYTPEAASQYVHN